MAVVYYYKGTDARIRIVIDDYQLRQQGITDFTLVGATIVTEFRSEDGDFIKFDNTFVTVVDATTYDITPTAAKVKEFQVGKHDISISITTGGGNTYGAKIKNGFEVETLIQT